MAAPANGNGNGVGLNRVHVSIIVLGPLLIGAVSAAAVLGYVRSEDLAKLERHKERIEALDKRITDTAADLVVRLKLIDDKVLGDKYPGWHRSTMLTWCLFTERENPGWVCYDPYLIPLATQASPGSFLHPETKWTTTVKKPRM